MFEFIIVLTPRTQENLGIKIYTIYFLCRYGLSQDVRGLMPWLWMQLKHDGYINGCITIKEFKSEDHLVSEKQRLAQSILVTISIFHFMFLAYHDLHVLFICLDAIFVKTCNALVQLLRYTLNFNMIHILWVLICGLAICVYVSFDDSYICTYIRFIMHSFYYMHDFLLYYFIYFASVCVNFVKT